ncbi:SusC/RagA family TonB-linked outer membrane protein [Cyclobacterium qasimii]|uniref:TonB-dependent receptor n=2 Tax=Cyclobacterium qasimii TaxID=1350429 RepID=S7VEZ5_9BACT|nr:SusC/RagA family TonB-linked outer membrane protein [Cyclobacterium qasimii]EPR68117.1 TonB-dependent receptor [Cyclobacterium qasimii M12-11B]GEO19987.1 SusC/RagA family TonB-linked outer membrane protein [Cyclobacterium qasimii]
MKQVLFKKFNVLKFRFLIVGLLSIITILPALAANTAKSIEDVKIKMDFLEGNLEDLLSNIESKTDYRFFYTDQALVDKDVLTLDRSKGSVADILKELARLKNLHFKQVNNNISVKFLENKAKNSDVEIVLDEADIAISGKITDNSGEPIPGVAIAVVGTSIGTITNIDGEYALNVPEDGVLSVSYIGFSTQRIQVNSRSIINVTMEEAIAGLDEVVVTALGIKREAKSLGYATSTVESDEMTINRSPNFINSLQGKVAGVNITSMGSGPQGSSKIRIRGVSSFGGNNSPLIVVNGVPIDNTNFGVNGDVSEVGSNRRSDSGDGLSSINPDDITSMTVLKGAAASALYGARAKDGVIMVTTRNRASGSGIQIELNTNYTNDTPLDFTDFQYEYGQGEGGLRSTSPRPVSGVWSFGEKIEPGMTQILFDGIEVPYTAQPNKIRDYYRNGSTLSNTITLSSGGENGGFSLSVANMDSKAILPGSNYNRKTINLGFTQNIKKLTVSGNINYSKEDRINPPNIAEQDFSPVVLYTLASSLPLALLEEYAFDENGDEFPYSRFTNRTNPYFALSRFENNIRDRVYGNITAKYDITDWLYVQGRFGQDFYSRDSEYNLPTGSQRQSSPPPGFVNGQYAQDIRRFREVNTDFLIGMNKTFGNFGLLVNLGGNQMYRRLDVNTLLGENFYTRDLYTIGNASKITTNYSISERQVNSLYASSELSWKGYLYLNGTVRNDWFSTLSPANRSIVYPSVTGSFVFSQAFENLPNWLSFGKVRLAYAEVGSDTDVQPYANNLFYNINPQQFPNSNGIAQPVGSVSGSVVPNANLRPMRVTEKEIGLEMTLFDNLRFELSYYDKLSSDQILQAQISNGSGYVNQLINVGESENKGLEMYAAISPVKTADFEWNFGANASYNQSKVLSLGDDVEGTFITVGDAEFHGELRQEVGKPMAQLYGWGYLRDDQGRQVFDPNSGRPIRSNEQLNFGSAIPVWVGGFTNSFNYKKLSFSFLVDFKLGHKMISGTHINAYRHGLDKATLVGRDQGYVVGEGVNPNGEINTTQSAIQPFYETIRAGRMSEQSVFNAGSWQLRQLTLGYDLSSLVQNSNFIKGLKFNVVSNNVAVIKKWVPHLHPDQNGIISDNMAGLEATGLPVTRSIGFNLNVKF